MLLRTVKLTKYFGGLRALDRVDFEIEQGEIVSIIGPNGSGKTTFFNLITGIYRPTEGRIIYGERQENLVGLKPHRFTEKGIARTFQTIRVFADMTVLENVMVGQYCRTSAGLLGAIARTKKAICEEVAVLEKASNLLAIFGEEFLACANELAANLSYANRKRLEIVRALATDPKLLLLDEPAAGMNPRESKRLMQDIRRIRDKGYTVIVIEHDMAVVGGISERVIVLDYGAKIAEGDFEQIKQNPQVIEAYLGRDHNAQAC